MDYFLAKKAHVLRAVGRHKEEMTWIAHRRGTKYTNTIVDTGNRNLRDLFTKLSRYYVDGQPMPEDGRVEAIAELLNKVRNNVFHGVKVYDDKEDPDLLRKVNPVLLAVLEESESEVG